MWSRIPYLLLALCVACLVAAWGGYRHGVETARDACAADAARVAHAADEAARADAAAESARRARQAGEMAAAAAAAREARLRGQLNALRSAPRPDCGLPDERLRDYAAAVGAANHPAAPERMPDALPAAADPHGR